MVGLIKLTDFLQRRKPHREQRGVSLVNGDMFRELIGGGKYQTLDQNPEVAAGVMQIARLIASMTIYLMANTKRGDVRIVNELSRKIDIEPNHTMTRSTWMTAIVMNLLLYGNGNAVVYPHTSAGRIDDLEPIAPKRVSFADVQGGNDYRINIDNVQHDPADLLHFVYNPRPDYPWLGQGIRVSTDVVNRLAQAAETEKAFMSSKWKPSIVLKVDALADEFSGKAGRKRLLSEYIETSEAGEPWVIPAENFSVDQIKPLSLKDLAITENVEMDKRTVAAILGIPPFVLGVGEYEAAAWDSFINNTIRPIAQSIEQELTRKLILSPSMYLMFNMAKLYSYDLQKIADVYGGLFDKGIVTGNEVRDKIGMQPHDGLDELLVLENYIPVSESGNQKKLGGET